MEQITMAVEQITPEKARVLLGRNLHNRNLSMRSADQFANAMLRGEWVFNGEPIRIGINDDGEDVLLDGQHRLAAVIQAKMDLHFLVIRGLPVSSQETMDQGKKRTFGDMLKMRGEKSVHLLAGATKMVWLYESQGYIAHQGFISPTVQQLFAVLEAHPNIREAIHHPGTKFVSNLFGGSHAVALYYLFWRTDEEDAYVFFERLSDGRDLERDDPIFVLRERMIRELARPNMKMDQKVRNALAIKAFNAWRAGRKVRHLKYQPGGAQKELFPEVKDCPVEIGKDRRENKDNREE